jgi:hypothetical protein
MNSALEMQVKLTSGHSSSALSIGQRVTLSFAAGDLALVPDGNPREAAAAITPGAARLEPARV